MNKLIEQTKEFYKLSQVSQQDIKSISGVNTIIFGARSWEYINKIVNILNKQIYNLSGQKLNFQQIVRNPSLESGLPGSLKFLATLSLDLWKMVSKRQNQAYTIDETKDFIDKYSALVNSQTIADPKAQSTKPEIINVLNQWQNIL